MKELLSRSLVAHANALERGEYTSLALTEAFLSRIEERRDSGAYLFVDHEGARAAARASDVRRAEGKALGVLDGIPFSVKDNISVRGLPMTCASKLLENYVPPFDATVVSRLLAAGAVLLGKNNMDEFALGSTGEESAYAPVPNPFDVSRVSGGSSSGSAVAVADGQAVFSVGTDTGGSVRQPAAFCGVYGLKPTYGLLSRYGVAAMASSLDAVGFLARDARDLLPLLSHTAGRDARDATSLDADVALLAAKALPSQLRVAVIGELLEEGISSEVREALAETVARLRALGAHVATEHLPRHAQSLAAYTVLSSTEAASNLSRYDGVRYGVRREGDGSLSRMYCESRGKGFGKEVKRRILFGTDMLRTENRELYYMRATKVRSLVRAEMHALMERYDLLLSPTSPTVAFARGGVRSSHECFYADMCTVYANLSGLPALSIPMGADANGLPIGMQLTAGQRKENVLIAAATLLQH